MLDIAPRISLDFTATQELLRGRAIDRLTEPDGLASWLEERELLDPAGAAALRSPSAARRARGEALRLRAAVRALFAAHAGGVPPDEATVHALDRVLRSTALSPTLRLDPLRSLELRWVEGAEGPGVVLAPVALSAVRVVTTVRPGRLRVCASPHCAAWFVDGSRGGRRRWCSMARCGNRRKAARHRARRVSAETG